MFRLIPLFFLMISLSNCKDSNVSLCDDIRQGLVDFNLELVKPNMESMLIDYTPDPTSEDPAGHEQNLNDFIEELNDECNLEASLVCYACIETFPEQSELRIQVDSSGTLVSRIVDIVTAEKLTVREIHF